MQKVACEKQNKREPTCMLTSYTGRLKSQFWRFTGLEHSGVPKIKDIRSDCREAIVAAVTLHCVL